MEILYNVYTIFNVFHEDQTHLGGEGGRMTTQCRLYGEQQA